MQALVTAAADAEKPCGNPCSSGPGVLQVVRGRALLGGKAEDMLANGLSLMIIKRERSQAVWTGPHTSTGEGSRSPLVSHPGGFAAGHPSLTHGLGQVCTWRSQSHTSCVASCPQARANKKKATGQQSYYFHPLLMSG